MADLIVLHVIFTVFWLWVLAGGGAERLEGTFASGFLISMFAPKWSAEGIKLFALATLVVGTIFFIVGYVNPEFRCFILRCQDE